MKRIVYGIMLMLLLVGMLTLIFNIQSAKGKPKTWNVARWGLADFQTIQEAINAANEGDTIFVRNGLYCENVVVNKTVSLIGESRMATIIDGKLHHVAFPDIVVDVLENNVSLTGFTIQNGEYGISIAHFGGVLINDTCVTSNNFIGVYLYCSHNNIFTENKINRNRHGVWLVGSNDNVFSGNDIVDNKQAFIVEGGSYLQDIDTSNKVNGKPIYYWINEQGRTFPSDAGYIAAVNCTDIMIENLTLRSSGQGVLLASTTNTSLVNTTLAENMYGLYLSRCRNITISENNITSNNFAAESYYSHNNNICRNIITKNRYGVDMLRSSENHVCENQITNQIGWGISLSFSRENSIVNNVIGNNEHGITLYESQNNLVYHNNFSCNAKQVHSYDSLLNIWDNGYPSGGNYWSDYNSPDLYSGPYQNESRSDGRGDMPYIIDELNQDNYPLMEPWFPDTTPPNITIISPKNETWHLGRDVDVSFMISEYISWIGYSLDCERNVTIAGNTTLTGLSYGPHNITVYAIDIIGNMGYSQEVHFNVTSMTDLNHDTKVDMKDIAITASAFGSYPSHPRWNPMADINKDDNVDMRDIALVARHFGETDP